MSIKQVTIIECDICGAVDKAKPTGRYNETEYIAPDGWKYGNNQAMHICPKCRAKLELNNAYEGVTEK